MSKILVEVKVGIDPTSTNLVTDPREYWLIDEGGAVTPTLFDGDIPGNHWELDGETLQINTTGSTSETWELDGTTLQLII